MGTGGGNSKICGAPVELLDFLEKSVFLAYVDSLVYFARLWLSRSEANAAQEVGHARDDTDSG
jgi:hypothetical protein